MNLPKLKLDEPYGGRIVVETLKKFGVNTIFTMCGGHISPILIASKQLGVRLVDTRHEATTVFAADALSRLSGIPGVAVVTAGPGLTNTITAVKNAQLALSPVILIGGATVTLLKGRGSLQDIDQHALLKPHCKWVKTIKKVKDLPRIIEKAFITCQSGVPGPVFLEIPLDILFPESYMRRLYFSNQPTKKKSLYKTIETKYMNYHLNKIFKGKNTIEIPTPPFVERKIIPDKKIDAVLERIKNAKRPLMLIGNQILIQPKSIIEIQQSLEKLQIPMYLQSTARGLMGRAHELVLRHKRKEAVREADLIILLGVPKDFRLGYGWAIRKSSFIVSVNLDKSILNKNRKSNIGIKSHPEHFLSSLTDRITQSTDSRKDWIDSLRKRDDEREKEILEQEMEQTDLINPVHLCKKVNHNLNDNSVLVADGGDFVAIASYILQPRGPLNWLDPGLFGTLGVGAGFALASKIFDPDSEVWIIFGDGSVGYSIMEYDTFIRHKIPVIAIVGNDAGWTQVERVQEEVFKENAATNLEYTSYEKVIQGFGAEGLVIKNSLEIDSILKQAKKVAKSGKPVLINVMISKSEFRKGSISM